MTKVSAFTTAAFDYSLCYYISGPMAGYTDNNFPLFQTATDICGSSGIKYVSPHLVKHEGEDLQWSDYLRGDILEMLEKCQGIILLPGWPQSKGARMELGIALKLDWPVYYLDPDFGLMTDFNRSPK